MLTRTRWLGENNAEVTVNWRAGPVSKPEGELLGAMLRMQPRARRHGEVHDADQWVFKDTGMDDGARIPGAVDMEYDRVLPERSYAGVRIQVMAHSPLTCKGQSRAADMARTPQSGSPGCSTSGAQAGWAPLLRPPALRHVQRAGIRITLDVVRGIRERPRGRGASVGAQRGVAAVDVLTDATDP